MSIPGNQKGALYRNQTTTLLNTREMEWEDDPALGKVKVLSRFATGEPSVFLLWQPPGGTRGQGELPHRHYHETVDEYHYVLEGEQPTWIYDCPEQAEGEGHGFLLREGYYLARVAGPGGLHGRERSATSETGCVMLIWRTGVGNMVREGAAARETIEVPYPLATQVEP